jgi:hypothetical protein
MELRKFIATTIREHLNEQESKILTEKEIIKILQNSELLKQYLTGEMMGKSNLELYTFLNNFKQYKDIYPNIFKPNGNVFYRTDTILKTPELEQMIMDDAYTVRNKPYIQHLSRLNADLLKGIKYQPKNKLQGWTSDEEFAWEHWYNVYIHNQGGDYVFDDENNFSCVYILNNTNDFLFNENFLDKLRNKFGGNGDELESIRLGGDVVCDVIIMNNL